MHIGLLGRGGSGKTSLAISIALTYVYKTNGSPIILCDWDFSNAKLTGLLRLDKGNNTINDYLTGHASVDSIVRQVAIPTSQGILAKAPIYAIPAREVLYESEKREFQIPKDILFSRIIELESYLTKQYAAPILSDLWAGAYSSISPEIENAVVSSLDVAIPVLIPDENEIPVISEAAIELKRMGITISAPILNKYNARLPFTSSGETWLDLIRRIYGTDPFIIPEDLYITELVSLNRVVLDRWGGFPSVRELLATGGFIDYLVELLKNIKPRKKVLSTEVSSWWTALISQPSVPQEVPKEVAQTPQPPPADQLSYQYTQSHTYQPIVRPHPYYPQTTQPYQSTQSSSTQACQLTLSPDIRDTLILSYPDGKEIVVEKSKMISLLPQDISPRLRNMIDKGKIHLLLVDKNDVRPLKSAMISLGLPLPTRGGITSPEADTKLLLSKSKPQTGILDLVNKLFGIKGGNGRRPPTVIIKLKGREIEMDYVEFENILRSRGIRPPKKRVIDLRRPDKVGKKIIEALSLGERLEGKGGSGELDESWL
ncbi:MAG: hypothetical protein QXR62_05365 [Candidatus Bathyarchaeia archaeon]